MKQMNTTNGSMSTTELSGSSSVYVKTASITHTQSEMSGNTIGALSGVIGFLSCLVFVAVGLIIWLFIDRRRKQQEIFRLTMLTVGFSSEDTNHLISRHPATPESLGAQTHSEASKCPALTIIPALARYHSRQLSVETPTESNNACAYAGPSQLNRTRAQSADVLTSIHLNNSPFGDYATIQNSDIIGSVRRHPRKERIMLRNPEQNIFENETPKENTENDDFATQEKEIAKGAALEMTSLSDDVKVDILRPKHRDITDVAEEERRYSLVRMRRFENSPTTSVNKSPRVSCNLLDEISSETAIKFAQNYKKRKSDRKSNRSSGSDRKHGSSGLYEDIEAPLPNQKKLSVASDDLTEVSDLSDTSSSCDSDDLIMDETVAVPKVVVTDANNISLGVAEQNNRTESKMTSSDMRLSTEWQGFEKDDTLLI